MTRDWKRSPCGASLPSSAPGRHLCTLTSGPDPYVGTRDDLLDLMTDATGAEYELAPPTGDWLAGLISFGELPASSSAGTAGWPGLP